MLINNQVCQAIAGYKRWTRHVKVGYCDVSKYSLYDIQHNTAVLWAVVFFQLLCMLVCLTFSKAYICIFFHKVNLRMFVHVSLDFQKCAPFGVFEEIPGNCFESPIRMADHVRCLSG